MSFFVTDLSHRSLEFLTDFSGSYQSELSLVGQAGRREHAIGQLTTVTNSDLDRGRAMTAGLR